MTRDAPAALVRKVFALLARAHVAERADRLRLGGYVGRRRAPVQPVQSGEAVLLTGMPSRRRVVRIPVWDLSNPKFPLVAGS